MLPGWYGFGQALQSFPDTDCCGKCSMHGRSFAQTGRQPGDGAVENGYGNRHQIPALVENRALADGIFRADRDAWWITHDKLLAVTEQSRSPRESSRARGFHPIAAAVHRAPESAAGGTAEAAPQRRSRSARGARAFHWSITRSRRPCGTAAEKHARRDRTPGRGGVMPSSWPAPTMSCASPLRRRSFSACSTSSNCSSAVSGTRAKRAFETMDPQASNRISTERLWTLQSIHRGTRSGGSWRRSRARRPPRTWWDTLDRLFVAMIGRPAMKRTSRSASHTPYALSISAMEMWRPVAYSFPRPATAPRCRWEAPRRFRFTADQPCGGFYARRCACRGERVRDGTPHFMADIGGVRSVRS